MGVWLLYVCKRMFQFPLESAPDLSVWRNDLNFKNLYDVVISQGLCTGCGTCAGICPTKGIQMAYADHELEPCLSGECSDCSLCYEVCPGHDIPLPRLDKMIFGRQRQPEAELLGIYQSCFAGHAVDSEIRTEAAAGGVATALLVYALEQGMIDGALVGVMDPSQPWRTLPKLAASRQEIIAAAQSKYQVVATNAALREVLAERARLNIACVGLGCHIQALRKLQLLHPSHKAARSLAFSIGLCCFANFYTRGTEFLIEERLGISLEQVAKVEYRGGAGQGNFRVTTKDGQVLVIPRAETTGVFLIRFFRRDRCLMCIDWSGELADISIGDYWGPEIDERSENLGWSTVIVRTQRGKQVVEDAVREGYLQIVPASEHYLVMTNGLYQKKHGAVHNLLKRKRYGWPTPDYHYPLILNPIPRDLPFDSSHWPHLRHHH